MVARTKDISWKQKCILQRAKEFYVLLNKEEDRNHLQAKIGQVLVMLLRGNCH